MKASDARAMTVDLIDDEVLKLKKEQFNLRFQRATGQLENTARLMTIARQKRAGEPMPEAKAAPAPRKPKRTSRFKPPAKPQTKAKSESKTKSKAKK